MDGGVGGERGKGVMREKWCVLMVGGGVVGIKTTHATPDTRGKALDEKLTILPITKNWH